MSRCRAIVQNMSLPKSAIAGNPIFAGVYQRARIDVNRANAALQRRSGMPVQIVLVQDRCFKSVGN